MHDKNSSPEAWDSTTYAETLRAITATLDVKQARLAEWAGVGQSQVSRWVAGVSRPGYEALRALRSGILDHAPGDAEVAELVDRLGAAAGYTELAGGPAPSTQADIPAEEVERIRALGLSEADTEILLQIRRSQIRQLEEVVESMRSREEHDGRAGAG